MEEQARSLLPSLVEARDRFMDLVEEIRPELHRYASRMTGSVFDGEDVVQDTLAKAYYALGQMLDPPNLRPWLFRIAHNTAMDFLKRYERTHVELVSDVPDRAESREEEGVDPTLVEAALAVFSHLPPVQRSAIILKDVLDSSLEETAATMGTSVGAVKAALSRARGNVARTSREPTRRPISAREEATLRRYAEHFNARNWDGLRALLGDEAQLDIVSRIKHAAATAGYYDRYAEITQSEDLRAQLGFVDGIPALAIFRPAASTTPAYFMVLASTDGAVALIRDFRYVQYIGTDARFEPMA